jgi:Holliday junction DNA helicase RuvA
MIDYIRGKLTVKEITRICVEAHGVGYEMNIPLSTYESTPAPGTDVKVLVHHHVREDAQKLYGFWTDQERQMFRQLITISNIGPKVALSVLSGISVEELIRCVTHSDPSRLEKIPGVGPKTAQRMVLELKGKVSPAIVQSQRGSPVKNTGAVTIPVYVRDEAFEAMIALGYNDKQVSKALSRVEQAIDKDAPVEEWIRKSLQVI